MSSKTCLGLQGCQAADRKANPEKDFRVARMSPFSPGLGLLLPFGEVVRLLPFRLFDSRDVYGSGRQNFV
jgi:hypothetical protein